MYSFLSSLTVSTQRPGTGTTSGFGFNHTLPSLCYASAVISACCCITLLNQTPTEHQIYQTSQLDITSSSCGTATRAWPEHIELRQPGSVTATVTHNLRKLSWHSSLFIKAQPRWLRLFFLRSEILKTPF